MALRTRRMARYGRLRRIGFLKFEAFALSKVTPSITPYLREMMAERGKLFSDSLGMKRSRRQFEESIRELYKTNRWLKRNRVGKIVADPWRMFRDFEDKFKAKNPQYTSPWQKCQKSLRDFIAKIERTIKTQQER